MGQTLSSAGAKVFNDQVDYYRDMRHPWFWVPISIGVITTIVSFVIMYLSSKKKQDGEKEEEKQTLSPALIAGLSAAVGLMNLFPIPVLDGGHLLFCAYEAITGRKPSDSAVQVLMTIGLFLVLSLTAFAVVMNFICP